MGHIAETPLLSLSLAAPVLPFGCKVVHSQRPFFNLQDLDQS